MTIAGEQCRASLTSRRFADAGVFARAIRDAGVDYVSLEAGRYEAHLPIPQRSSVVVRRAADRAHVTQDAVDPDRLAMLLPIRSPAALNINGWSVGETDVLVPAPGGELHALCPAAGDWASHSLSRRKPIGCSTSEGRRPCNAAPNRC